MGIIGTLLYSPKILIELFWYSVLTNSPSFYAQKKGPAECACYFLGLNLGIFSGIILVYSKVIRG